MSAPPLASLAGAGRLEPVRIGVRFAPHAQGSGPGADPGARLETAPLVPGRVRLGPFALGVSVDHAGASATCEVVVRNADGAILDPRVEAALQRLETDEAMHSLDDALKRDPTYAGMRRSRGSLRTVRGDWSGAIADYQAALAADPSDPGTLNNLAWLLLEEAPDSLRNFEEAARLAERAVEQAPQDPYVLGTWGTVRLRAGAPAEAAALLERALSMERPPFVEATDRYLLAIALARVGDAHASRETLQHALRTDPANRYREEAESALAAADSVGTLTQSAPAP